MSRANKVGTEPTCQKVYVCILYMCVCLIVISRPLIGRKSEIRNGIHKDPPQKLAAPRLFSDVPLIGQNTVGQTAAGLTVQMAGEAV